MLLEQLEMRKCDNHGCGHFGASRGKRLHNGIDLLMNEGEQLQSTIFGEVTKIGFPYAEKSKSHIRYVEVTSHGYKYRFFYIQPVVEVGDAIKAGDILGVCQDLTRMYHGIGNHIHFEIKDKNGTYIDPTPAYIALKATA